MLNYILMDFKRLLRTRSFYLALLIAVFFLSMFALAGYYVTGFAEEFVPQAERMMNEQVLEMARGYMTFNLFFSFFFSLPGMRMLHALLSLFAAGFLSREHHSGYLKNLLSIRGMRARWMVSKLLVLLTASILYYALFGLACALVQVFYGNPVAVNFAQVLPFLGGQLLVDMALFSVIMLVVILFQTKAAAVLVAMMLSLNMQGLLYLLIDWVNVLPFKLARYGMMNLAAKAELPGGIVGLMGMAAGGSGIGMLSGGAEALLPVAAGVFLLFTALSAFFLYRADYKG